MWINKRVMCLSKKASSNLLHLISFQLNNKLNLRKKHFVYKFCNVAIEEKLVKMLRSSFTIPKRRKKKWVNKHGNLMQG